MFFKAKGIYVFFPQLLNASVKDNYQQIRHSYMHAHTHTIHMYKFMHIYVVDVHKNISIILKWLQSTILSEYL